jgi:hypothetical protein
MSVDLTVPPWLNQYIRAWLERLHLNDWTIKVAVELCVNDDPACRGLCDQFPDANTARLTFRADIEDTPEWRHVVIHELIHVAHSRIDHAVERAILPELPQPVQQLAREIYHQHVESYVDYLDSTLYKATVALDYPEEASA